MKTYLPIVVSEIGGVIMEVEIGALCFEDARRDPQPRSASRNWTD